jgi:glutamine cyclotransferase
MHLAFRTGTYISLILLNVVAATRPMVFQSNAKAGKPDQLTSSSAVTPVYLARVVDVYPHDPSAFTEGLVFQDGFLYEGTGLNGKSTLRRVDLATGQVLQSHALPFQYFGEGITIYGDRIIQLTWTTQVGFAYDKDSFALQQIFSYGTQGWGITHDETRLIMSDGTSTLLGSGHLCRTGPACCL